MALPDRLARIVSTTAFRVAAITVAVYLGVRRARRRPLAVADQSRPDQRGAGDAAVRGRASEGRGAGRRRRGAGARRRGAQPPGRAGPLLSRRSRGQKGRRQFEPPAAGDRRQRRRRRVPLRARCDLHPERLAVAIPVDIGGGLQPDRRPRRRGAAPLRRRDGHRLFSGAGLSDARRSRRRFCRQPRRAEAIETINVAARSIMAGDMSRRISVPARRTSSTRSPPTSTPCWSASKR